MSCILLLEPDESLRRSRTLLLERQGYEVESVDSVADAVAKLKAATFDLVLIGRNALQSWTGVAFVWHESFPEQKFLKIGLDTNEQASFWTTIVDSAPERLLAAIKEMVTAQKA